MPKRTRPLTDKRVKGLKPGAQRIDYRDGHSPGLILTVLPSGRKQWAVRYVVAGKHRRHVLGDYPDLSLSKAREDAADLRPALRRGDDPAAAKRARTQRPTDTVAALAAEYLKRHAEPNKRTAADDERTLNVEVLPRWKDRSVRSLTRRDVRALLHPIIDRDSPIMANRVLALVRKMLNYGVDNDWLDANPAAAMRRPAPERSRDRVLTDDELRKIWRCLHRLPDTTEKAAPNRKRATGTDDDPICPVSSAQADILKLRLLTGQRGGEVVRMRWSDLDLSGGWWTIPAEHTKNGQAHRVPLTGDVIAILETHRPEDDDGNPIEAPEGNVFIGTGESMRDRAKKAPARLATRVGIDFRGHDLRRTAATRMAAAGIPRESISAVLNHVQGGAVATRTYDRYNRDAEKRVALETWNRELARILAETPASNVVPMARRA